MNSNAQEVLTAALNLSADERLEVVEALVVSFQTEDGPPFDESWREVIRRGSAELRSGQVTSVRWSEIEGSGS